MNPREIAEKIYNTISTADFAHWYGLGDVVTTGGDFDLHIQGDPKCLNKDHIIEQIITMFKLN